MLLRSLTSPSAGFKLFPLMNCRPSQAGPCRCRLWRRLVFRMVSSPRRQGRTWFQRVGTPARESPRRTRKETNVGTKLGKNEFPSAHGADDFKCFGPPALKDGEFESCKIA